MAKNWDYAELAQKASEAGGPAQLIKTIEEAAYKQGSLDTKNTIVAPILLTGVGVGAVVTIGGQKIKKWVVKKREEKRIAENNLINAKECLKEQIDMAVEGIEEIDEMNEMGGSE